MSLQVRKILGTLEAAGFETWCVGGAIRDALLGIEQHDVDLATAARPADVQRLFRRTVPVGIEHGTVGVLDELGTLHEVTTFRRDVQTDGRHAVVEFGASLLDDLARRDFTINAIAYHPVRDEWADPFDGRIDLANRLVRAVGNPATRFREDHLRIVRAFRFAARFGFSLDAPTWDAAVANAAETAHLSAERIRSEWIKGLAGARDVVEYVRLWRASGVTAVWMPECTIDAIAPGGVADPFLITALFVTANAPVWQRLKGSSAEIRRAVAIDRGPAAPLDAGDIAVRRWLHAVAGAADDFAALAEWRTGVVPEWVMSMRAIRIRGDATAREALAVTGADLLEAGVPPGPQLGKLLETLLQAVLEDPGLNRRDALLDKARTLS